MRLVPIALATLLLSLPLRADDPPVEQLPLNPIATARLRFDGACPVPHNALRAVVGRLPEGAAADWKPHDVANPLGRCTLAFGDGTRPELARNLADGALALRPPVAGEPVVVALVGPFLNSGESWGPTEVRRRGRTITVVVESWTDNRPRLRNIPSRFSYVLFLGTFPAEGLEVVIAQRAWFMNADLGPLYAERTAPAPATIAVPPAPAAPLEHTGTCDAVDDPKAPACRQQPSASATSVSPDVAPGVTVGAPEPPVAGGIRAQLVKVVGPTLDSYEAVTVRSVTWEGKRATIAIDVWRDHGGRDKNVPWRAELLVRLEPPPALAAGGFDVAVEWTVWMAKALGGPAVEDPGERQAIGEEATWTAAWAPK